MVLLEDWVIHGRCLIPLKISFFMNLWIRLLPDYCSLEQFHGWSVYLVVDCSILQWMVCFVSVFCGFSNLLCAHCCWLKVNATISELKTDSKRHQNPGFESYLDRQLYFFPGIIHWIAQLQSTLAVLWTPRLQDEMCWRWRLGNETIFRQLITCYRLQSWSP